VLTRCAPAVQASAHAHQEPFKAAVVMVNAIFLLGDAIGHVRQMIAADNFAPGNAGVPFLGDIAFPVLALILLMIVRQSEAAPRIS
jgi:hypothetical protein